MDIQSVPESISEQPSIKNSFTKGNYSVYAWCAITLIVILTAAWWFYSIRSHPSMTDQHNTKDILSAQTGLPDTPSANSTVVVEDASISPDTLHMIADFKVLFDSNATAAPSVYGIDISKYQGTLLRDLESLDTLHFVICKATEGIKETDLDFKLNWPLIKQKGLIRGAYHFFHSEDPPIQQAQLYLKTIVGLQSTDMPPIVDIEETSIKTRITPYRLDSSLLIFLRYVLEKTGRRPIIYCDVAFANKYLLDESLASYPLWIAEYSKKPIPAIPDLWKNRGYVIWQRSSSYDIDARSTDFDVFNGNGKAFAKFITTH